MSHERIREIISHLEAYDANFPPPEDPKERLAWSVGQRALLHAAHEGGLEEIEDVWHIAQVARGEVHGAN